ncbi:MAG TPA: transaldolase [Thermoanaerobaculia bacterium]|nr:transaldolase [Thermoanaerobaculia bacterium]
MTRAVFLDRDGVLNHAEVRGGKPHPPADAAAMTIVPGAADALLRLRRRDFRLIVVTNQPDVARGTQRRDVVEAMNDKLRAALPVDEVIVCWHDGDDCDCRKPKPGALLDAARRHGIDLAQSFLVGDRWRDIEAGQRAGVRCLFIDHGYEERQPVGAFVTVDSIVGAAEEILRMSEVPSVESLKVKIFADGADRAGMLEMYARPYIKGFTTNPTLMHKAGLTDYRAFAHSILEVIPDRPISFEVFSDEIEEMERQAREIARWGDNVYVKVPITNTRSESTVDLVRRLSNDGVKVNVTAMMTLEQVRDIGAAVKDGAPSCVSVFAGRIADTGRDPVPLMRECVEILRAAPRAELIWASPRELLNIFQADAIGCHIITVTNDILKKLDLVGKDLGDYSLDTVKMFFNDGRKAGFSL